MTSKEKTELFERTKLELKRTLQVAEGMSENPLASQSMAHTLVDLTSRCHASALAFETAMRGLGIPQPQC